jgi:hypothetical protein
MSDTHDQPFTSHIPTRTERKFLREVCGTYGLPTVYVWQSLALWMRIRPHVMTKGVPPVVCESYLQLTFHLALMWLGPQDVCFRYKEHVPHRIVKAMIRYVFPDETDIHNYRELQIHVFLTLLGGSCL